LLHSRLPFWCLGVGEGSPVRFRFNIVSGGKESNGVECRAYLDVVWTSD
jgi:hypothetical protein